MDTLPIESNSNHSNSENTTSANPYAVNAARYYYEEDTCETTIRTKNMHCESEILTQPSQKNAVIVTICDEAAPSAEESSEVCDKASSTAMQTDILAETETSGDCVQEENGLLKSLSTPEDKTTSIPRESARKEEMINCADDSEKIEAEQEVSLECSMDVVQQQMNIEISSNKNSKTDDKGTNMDASLLGSSNSQQTTTKTITTADSPSDSTSESKMETDDSTEQDDQKLLFYTQLYETTANLSNVLSGITWRLLRTEHQVNYLLMDELLFNSLVSSSVAMMNAFTENAEAVTDTISSQVIIDLAGVLSNLTAVHKARQFLLSRTSISEDLIQTLGQLLYSQGDNQCLLMLLLIVLVNLTLDMRGIELVKQHIPCIDTLCQQLITECDNYDIKTLSSELLKVLANEKTQNKQEAGELFAPEV